MKRKKLIRIEVKDQSEGESIARALNDPMTRAFVVIVGTLLPLGDRARTRILTFINDKANDEAGRISIESRGSQHHVEASAPLP
jgi:hypothetical protein